MSPSSLKITRARENNLKEISLEIPHDELVVVTGISGSGKSSLAFDTVYAEGQRRYIETFSPYTRQFLDKVKRPNVDLVENVRPAIAIQQRTRVLGSRSTVGSMTNVNDYLKLLWSNISEPICPQCKTPFVVWKAAALAEHVIQLHQELEFPTLYITARADLSQKPFVGEVERLRALGYSRLYDPRTSTVVPLEEAQESMLDADRSLVLLFDRLKAGAAATSAAKRLRESLEQALAFGNGLCQAITPERTPQVQQFSNRARCTTCSHELARPRPALFSFNHPLGACAECKGFGKILTVDPDKVVANPNLSLEDNALQCWAGPSAAAERRKMLSFATARGISTTSPWRTLSAADRTLLLENKTKEYRGVIPWFKKLESKAYKMHVRVFLAKYRMQVDCPACNGTRFTADALAYRVAGKTIADLFTLPIGELASWIIEQQGRLTELGKIPRQLKDVFSATIARLNYLVELGLPYLSLDRQSRTLSGGETQRVNLATALGSELVSTHFVLDEPSVGLHARDTERLITAVRGLQRRGNSVLVVEHDLDCIAAADSIIEIGPEAGKGGGEVVYNGSLAEWRGIDRAQLLPVVLKNDAARLAAINNSAGVLRISNAQARNLKGLSVEIPLGRFVCLSGVSGSGKSTLVHEVIKRAYDRYLLKIPAESSADQVLGFENIDQLLIVDQSALAKSPRANIATYVGIWDTVRDLLSESDEAQSRALSRSAFSFNVVGGRCPACEGAGFIREDMQFLSDVFIPCEVCLGRRFQESVLEVRYKGKNAHDFLQMSVAEALDFFTEHPKLRSAAKTLSLLGLAHLTLGHPLSELSGGEAQRLKLVPFIEQAHSGRSLLIFDEPTTGLHAYDVRRLIELLNFLTSRGHSVLCVEHNMAMLASADWLIDLGPEGGAGGGQLLCAGEPRTLAKTHQKQSQTMQFLARFLDEQSNTINRVAPRAIKRSATAAKEPQSIRIEGAREHNLKNIDIEVPLNKIVALTGVSGSGKSSIAKDIIYAEGQRQYLDCLSPYARQFIQELRRPDIDHISNVKPAICVYQHTFQPSKFSTLGTMSEAYNYLRLMYAKLGAQYCPDHPSERISPLSPDEITREIRNLKGKTVRLLAPVIKGKKGNHRAVLERAVSAEIQQVRIDGVFLSPGSVNFAGGLEKTKVHTIEFVVGKFNPDTAPADLVRDAVALALSLGSGNVIVHVDKSETVYSVERTCQICKRGFFKPDPEDLSFHSKRGRCEGCHGAGRLEDNALCTECNGARINELGRNLRIGGRNIHEASLLTPPQLRELFSQIQFSVREQALSAPVLRELYARLETLEAVGLDYIPLDRDCTTLSGGELQRLRLATAMGSPLTGALYIFDEPSAGLHPEDNERVLERLRELQQRGNSVILIEHDGDTILASDHVIEVGPGGGKDGGTIVFTGTPKELLASSETVTAQCLRASISGVPITITGDGSAPLLVESMPEVKGKLTLTHGSCNTISDLSVSIPLGGIVSVCGVSGSGKSSLVHGLLCNLIENGKQKENRYTIGKATLESDVAIDRLLLVDQKPIGANSRSTPASYLGIFDEIRKVFANALEAKSRGWAQSFFSYNTGKGRCAECKGAGVITLEMNFLPDASVTCESCGGSRYSDEAQSVLYAGMTISDALNFTFEEAKSRFANHRKILRPIRQACELGLGYLKLGQSSTSLSGGESQRIKLVSELSRAQVGHTLYVLDEPTTGLHKADVSRLMNTLRELANRGNSVVLIEHDPDVLRQSDYLLEMGPGPGAAGGKIIFAGTPDQLLAAPKPTPWQKLLRIGGVGLESNADERTKKQNG